MAAKKAEAKPAEVEADSKVVTLKSPWGSKVTVAAEDADTLRDAGYTASK